MNPGARVEGRERRVCMFSYVLVWGVTLKTPSDFDRREVEDGRDMDRRNRIESLNETVPTALVSTELVSTGSGKITKSKWIRSCITWQG